ncbi:hypothetical protein BX070DRAFT_218897, partial [Coemansia spiralis]
MIHSLLFQPMILHTLIAACPNKKDTSGQPKKIWRLGGSIPGPLACKASVLPL